MRLADGRIQQTDQRFEFTPAQLDELARIAGLGRETPEFTSYAAVLSEAVGAFQGFRIIHEQPPDMGKTLETARTVAKKAAALLAQLNRLRPPDVQWLHKAREIVDPDPKYSIFSMPTENSSKVEEWHRQHSLAYYGGEAGMEAYYADPMRRPAWLREFMTELEMLQRIAQTLGDIPDQAPRGPKPNAPRIILARRLAQDFFTNLKRRPTKGRGSEFEQTLRFCLAAAGEYVGDANSRRDLHTLVATALGGMNFESP